MCCHYSLWYFGLSMTCNTHFMKSFLSHLGVGNSTYVYTVIMILAHFCRETCNAQMLLVQHIWIQPKVSFLCRKAAFEYSPIMSNPRGRKLKTAPRAYIHTRVGYIHECTFPWDWRSFLLPKGSLHEQKESFVQEELSCFETEFAFTVCTSIHGSTALGATQKFNKSSGIKGTECLRISNYILTTMPCLLGINYSEKILRCWLYFIHLYINSATPGCKSLGASSTPSCEFVPMQQCMEASLLWVSSGCVSLQG